MCIRDRRGTDEAEVPVPNGEYCKTAKIGRAIMDADIFISLTHFKGHESTGFDGTLKNIGMGCGSRAGKMIQQDVYKRQGDSRCATRCNGPHGPHCAQDLRRKAHRPAPAAMLCPWAASAPPTPQCLSLIHI